MATISPLISTSTTPGLSVSMVTPGLTYAGFVNGLGSYVYKIDEMFYGNLLYAQLAQAIKYNRYDNSGDSAQKMISTPVSPAQFQPTMYVPLKARNVVIDGQGTLDFNMIAGNAIQFIFYAQSKNITDALNINGPDNFKTVERALGKPGFFDDEKESTDSSPDIKFIDDENEEGLNFSEPPPRGLHVEPLITERPRKQSFILNLTNNTSGNIPVSLFNQGSPGSLGLFNATTRYQWDITGISYATPNVSLPVYPSGSTGAYSVLTGRLQQQNAQGLVDLLNSFGVGSFWLETSGPNTYIVSWNSNLVYGALTVGVATTSIAWVNSSTDSTMTVDANAVNIINSVAPPQSGTVSVNNGDSIDGSYLLGVAPPFSTILITRTFRFPPFNTQTIYTDNGSGFGGLIPAFIIDISYEYNIALTTP